MDPDLERATAMSRAEQGNDTEEDGDLQEAIRLSMMENEVDRSTFREDVSAEPHAGKKRKASEQLGPTSIKHAPSISGDEDPYDADLRVLSSPAQPTSAKPSIKYQNGALRITRTPGRQNAKNCVNLKDVIQGQHLVSACIFSFFIAESELFQHLPLSHSPDAVPIYIGRDANQDSLIEEACQQAGISLEGKLKKHQLESITPHLIELSHKHYGNNYNAFYAYSPGSSHTKILILVYPQFLRLVITSCNMMNIDTVLGDNHWYIHDMPKRSSRAKKPLPFEADLLTHLKALNTPDDFIESIWGFYDYSEVEVHLVTSIPGVCSGSKAEKHGLLRLRRIVKDLDMKLPSQQSGKLRLEVCAASLGNLSAKWLNGFNDCALGKGTISVSAADCVVPDLKLFYPTVGDVKAAYEDSQQAATNIGCHIRPWKDAPTTIKNLFHHYESKDTGRLFHQKLIMAYNPQDKTAVPYFVYIGSANLSQSAWGALEQDKTKTSTKRNPEPKNKNAAKEIKEVKKKADAKKMSEATCNTKLVKMSNFECGVVIPGSLILNLLEPGTRSWQSGIVPYNQAAPQYELPKDRPWNDPRWVQNFREDYQDDYKGEYE